jgi:hypothetical protein
VFDHRLSRPQAITLAVLAGVSLSITWLYLSQTFPPSLKGGGDLRVFLAAAKLLREHRSPYNGQALTLLMQSLDRALGKSAVSSGFEYLPFVGLLLLPMAGLSFHAAFIVTDLLSIIAVIWSVDRWRAWLAPELPRALVLFGAMVSAPVAFTLFDGKLDGIMFLGFTLCALLYRRRQWVTLGVLVALTTMLKPQALFLLPFAYLVLSVQTRKSVTRYLAGGLATVALSCAAVSLYDLQLWGQWWHYLPTFSSSLNSLQLDSAGFTGFTRYLGLGLGFHDPLVWLILLCGLLFSGWWLWHSLKVGRADQWPRRWLEVVGVATVLNIAISPYVHNGELILFIPLLLWLLHRHALPAWYLWLMLFLFQTTQLIELPLSVAFQKSVSTSPIVTLLVLLAMLSLRRPIQERDSSPPLKETLVEIGGRSPASRVG